MLHLTLIQNGNSLRWRGQFGRKQIVEEEKSMSWTENDLNLRPIWDRESEVHLQFIHMCSGNRRLSNREAWHTFSKNATVMSPGETSEGRSWKMSRCWIPLFTALRFKVNESESCLLSWYLTNQVINLVLTDFWSNRAQNIFASCMWPVIITSSLTWMKYNISSLDF